MVTTTCFWILYKGTYFRHRLVILHKDWVCLDWFKQFIAAWMYQLTIISIINGLTRLKLENGVNYIPISVWKIGFGSSKFPPNHDSKTCCGDRFRNQIPISTLSNHLLHYNDRTFKGSSCCQLLESVQTNLILEGWSWCQLIESSVQTHSIFVQNEGVQNCNCQHLWLHHLD